METKVEDKRKNKKKLQLKKMDKKKVGEKADKSKKN